MTMVISRRQTTIESLLWHSSPTTVGDNQLSRKSRATLNRYTQLLLPAQLMSLQHLSFSLAASLSLSHSLARSLRDLGYPRHLSFKYATRQYPQHLSFKYVTWHHHDISWSPVTRLIILVTYLNLLRCECDSHPRDISRSPTTWFGAPTTFIDIQRCDPASLNVPWQSVSQWNRSLVLSRRDLASLWHFSLSHGTT